jgi:hypothetical protein
MIGLIPASGKASRLNGLPKFSLPFNNEGDSVLSHHVMQMKRYCEIVVVSTTSQWRELLESFNLDIDIMIIEPSTMNDALLKMSDKYKSNKYLVGMADTLFYKENPYDKLYSSILECQVAVACWKINDDLKGRVGQVDLYQNTIINIKDKDLNCKYNHMWGALAFDRNIISRLEKNNSHPGIDLEKVLPTYIDNHYAFEVDGKYFDVGTMAGYKELINYII